MDLSPNHATVYQLLFSSVGELGVSGTGGFWHLSTWWTLREFSQRPGPQSSIGLRLERSFHLQISAKYKYRKPFEDQLGWDRIAKINIRASLLQGAMYTSAIIIKGKISERKVETVYGKKVFDGCHWECHVMPCFSGQY